MRWECVAQEIRRSLFSNASNVRVQNVSSRTALKLHFATSVWENQLACLHAMWSSEMNFGMKRAGRETQNTRKVTYIPCPLWLKKVLKFHLFSCCLGGRQFHVLIGRASTAAYWRALLSPFQPEIHSLTTALSLPKEQKIACKFMRVILGEESFMASATAAWRLQLYLSHNRWPGPLNS